jgi:serine/threonine-protein kinase
MGTVYEAEHTYIKKRVALKLLRPEITSNQDALARFQREALAASTIGHANIVSIDDFGRLSDGQVYLTMEYLDGLPLDEVIDEGAMALDLLLEVAIQVCHGLAAAHAKGIVHRDMKPENIFLVEDGAKAKILDFGIAKVLRADSSASLTKTGTVFGTPNYMAPEQALGRKVDHRADIYSMGVILYQMATGLLPFRADSFVGILTQHVTEPPLPPSSVAPEREVPEALERLIMRAMAKDPEERCQDMGEMVAALLEIRRGVVGDAPMRSHLRLSRIHPPVAEASLATAPALAQVTATAGELVGPLGTTSRRRRGLVAGATAVALVVAGSLAAFKVLHRPPGRTAKTEVVAAAAHGPSSPGETGQGPRSVTNAPDRGAAQTTPPRRRQVKVSIVSEPLHATVERDGRAVGQTPLMLEAEEGHPLRITLSMKGYRAREVEIEPTENLLKTVQLDRLKPKGRAQSPSKAVGGAGRERGKKRGAAGREDSHGSEGDEILDAY